MKQLALFLLTTTTVGCSIPADDNKLKNEAIHFSSVFITQNFKSIQRAHVQSKKVVSNEKDSIYRVTGSIERYSPMNYPVSIIQFSETLQYVGGSPQAQESWRCIDIYIGNKKVK